jgi:hypothetical protein
MNETMTPRTISGILAGEVMHSDDHKLHYRGPPISEGRGAHFVLFSCLGARELRTPR